MTQQRLFAFALALLTAFTLACSRAPSTPTAPSGSNPDDLGAAADGSTLKVTAPTPVAPIGGVEVTDLDPDLVIENSKPLYVPSLDLSYIFEVIDEDGQLVYTSPAIPQGSGGRTIHEIGMDLDANEAHTWRARAVYQGRQGPRSTIASFKTFDRFGVSCAHLGSELAIVECRKAQYVHIEHDLLPEFLERVAHDLNKAPMEHAPYGRLVKTSGNNCGGYACDIICSDQGLHRQWDVLIDEDVAQIPGWNRVGDPTPRPCEIVQ